jgi:hypothetical protein
MPFGELTGSLGQTATAVSQLRAQAANPPEPCGINAALVQVSATRVSEPPGSALSATPSRPLPPMAPIGCYA